MIAGLFIFNRYGETLISRIYRDDEAIRNSVSAFREKVIFDHPQLQCPVTFLEEERTSVFHIKRGDLWICAITRLNANAGMAFELLIRLAQTMEKYLQKISEESVQNNFVLLYELLDEMIDYGYPQITDFGALKTYITQKGVKPDRTMSPEKITSHVTGHVSWRPKDIIHKKNTFYIDVCEDVDLLMSHEGKVLSSHVAGKIVIRSQLSGMPECKLAISDLPPTKGKVRPYLCGQTPGEERAANLDCHFHQCVKLSTFKSEHTINFVPPDGEFELMRYHTSKDLQLPFSVIPLMRETERTKFEAKVFLKSMYASHLTGRNIKIRIPVPPRTIKAKLSYAKGKAKFKSDAKEITWEIAHMVGGKRIELLAELELDNTVSLDGDETWKRPPISMNFRVPYVPSGLKIRYLRVTEPYLNYSDIEVVKWVRYIGQAGNYETRC
ncbi:hypothetical protein QR680_006725 [Steinernema hermaphroditum]|uniref:MHD domain-containing protein n=1 Tax=Steinernema hermaphroditum TaxID=289476 RepID=A0AA39HXT3_9BILA|nr:hypothetical protein QR680_006725 [Steinernema hermaphroditum]